MTCIIVEDQPPAQRLLQKYIEDIGTLELKSTFPNALQAMAYLATNPVDLVFLDIHLPKMSGLDFLKNIDQSPAIILTTAFPNYALESYNFSVIDYLLKPFTFQRFEKAVAKVPSKLNAFADKEIFIKSGYEHFKIKIMDIDYIKSDGDYTELYTAQKKYISSEPLRKWVSKLGAERFIRVHKSFVINIKKIERITGSQIRLQNDIVVPIGRTYKEEVSRHLFFGKS